jgi:hypothetical protein
MSTTPVCPCDAAGAPAITNLPGLSQIAFRAGDFNSFRQALLTPLLAAPGQPPLEASLTTWQSGVGADPSVVDLAVMMIEWWAYLCDILTFYNERIANEDYLRTALLPETPGQLIRLLGYRPRPTIGATGTLAALVTPSILPGQTVTLPQGLQFQSKPGPGGAPQTFELSLATQIELPDQVTAIPPPNLVEEFSSLDRLSFGGRRAIVDPTHGHGPVNIISYAVLLKGTVKSLSNGMVLLLGPRDDNATPNLITVSSAPSVQTVTGGGTQTQVNFTADPAPGPMTAENARLMKPNQTAPLWTLGGSSVSGTVVSGNVVQMAGVVRKIQPNDWVVFTAPSAEPQLVQITATQDIFGDANPAYVTPNSIPSGDAHPIPMLHTQLTLGANLDSDLSGTIDTVSLLYDWVEVGTLIDQPPALWDGVSTSLQAVQPAQFAPGGPTPILMQDANGVGQQASGTVDSNNDLDFSWPPTVDTPLSPGLQPPIAIYYNLLPVTCGKTITNEVLGTGDATVPGQSFMLAKSPVTYLTTGSSYASTIKITVNGLPWTEVASFYGQPANAQIFVTREDSNQNTWVDFGDGVNGSRLLTGAKVVANYRIGGGAPSPPAGKLTVIAQSYPGLRSIVNPVAVSGGSDPDPASLIKEYAPRSVLTFGRAVSVFDYQAIAAQAPGVTMATATWSLGESNQQAGVTVWVAGEPNVAASVQTLLTASGDPNRPVTALQAVEISVTLTIAFVIAAGTDVNALTSALTTALCDPLMGLFSPANLGIGQGLFDSDIEAACLQVAGVIGIQSSQFAFNTAVDLGPLHLPGEGSYFSLVTGGFFPSTVVVPND